MEGKEAGCVFCKLIYDDFHHKFDPFSEDDSEYETEPFQCYFQLEFLSPKSRPIDKSAGHVDKMRVSLYIKFAWQWANSSGLDNHRATKYYYVAADLGIKLPSCS